MTKRPSDWPGSGPIDLAVHDLPHVSSHTEWWYVNAHTTADDGRRLSLFAAFFRMAIGRDEVTGEPVFGHSLTWAITDWSRKRYLPVSRVDARADKIAIDKLDRGEGSRDPRLNRAFREVFEKGKVPRPDRKFEGEIFVAPRRLELDFDGTTFRKQDDGSYVLHLNAPCEPGPGHFGGTFTFRPLMEAVRHGRDGVVKSPDGADMFYYFIPQCEVQGHFRLDSQDVPVSGQGWYDHEFGYHPAPEGRAEAHSFIAAEALESTPRNVAWNWLALQLEGGHQLSAYALVDSRTKDLIDQRAIFVSARGERTEHPDALLTPTRNWQSTRTFNSFPVAWSLNVPSLKLECQVEAVLDDQEFVALISKTTFWEGACTAEGTQGGKPIRGVGYVERSGFVEVDTLDEFFSAVGRQVRVSVGNVLPREPNAEQQRDLVAAEGHEHLLEGVHTPTFVANIIEPLRLIVDRGGKSWRSYGALACCDIVGGDSREYVAWLALPELIHVGSMIVDDVQDRSTVRRGGPPVHAIFGEAVAINAGTAAYFLAQKLLRGKGISQRDQLRLYDQYFFALRAGHTGQALDIAGFSDAAVQAVNTGDSAELEARILAANRLKTAVPAACLARMGAIVGGGSDAQVAGLGAFFEALGLAFQVVDDLLNLRGFKGDLKNRGEDITAGKVTLPVAKGLSRLEPEERRWLWEVVRSQPTDPAVIGQVIDALERCGALDAADKQAREMVEGAWQHVDPLVEDSMPKIMLRAFGWYVLDRHY